MGTRGCRCQGCSSWTAWIRPPCRLCWISIPLCCWIPTRTCCSCQRSYCPPDEPAVYAAKVAHAAAGGVVNPVGVYGLAYAGLVAHPNGAVVPVEPADVVAARAEHLAAVASA